jgi:hypothetical protein
MPSAIEIIFKENINLERKFSLQIDESTGISAYAQLIATIRYRDGDITTSTLLSRKELPDRATSKELLCITN